MSDMARGVVLSLVERGWQAARTCSMEMASESLPCLHLVKGHLAHEVRGLIAPIPHVRLVSVPRRIFWPLVALWCLRWHLTGMLRGLLVDNERSYRRLKRWAQWLGIDLFLIKLVGQGYELWSDSMRSDSRKAFNDMKRSQPETSRAR